MQLDGENQNMHQLESLVHRKNASTQTSSGKKDLEIKPCYGITLQEKLQQLLNPDLAALSQL